MNVIVAVILNDWLIRLKPEFGPMGAYSIPASDQNVQYFVLENGPV
jgi:hypothetical protein